ncbi:MAG: porin family protein [Gammaproteobacteria bacterium]
MNNTTRKLAAILAAAMLSVPAAAQEESDKSGFFVAPEVGQVKAKDYCDQFPSSWSCEDSEIMFGISGGYQFNEFFAAEGGVRFASGFDFTSQDGSVNGDVDFMSFSIGGRARLPFGGNFAATGKAGFHFWEADASITGTTSVELSDDDTDPYFGGGLEFIASDNIAVRAEYTRYQLDDDDADVISGAVVVRF